MKRGLSFLMLAAVAALAPPVCPQTANPHPPTATHNTVFGFGPAGTIVSPKPHAPFSGVLTVQADQTLSDGVTIARRNEEIVMRDGMGRVYRAREIKETGAGNRGPRLMITILDPVQNVEFVCTPLKICRKMQYRPFVPHQPHGWNPEKGKNVTVEDLGSSNVNGVDVDGKRVARIIPEGMVGNDRPFTTTEELWHSKELDVDVVSKRSDPRSGTRTAELTQIIVGEPDPKYFQIPEGYRIEEGGPLSVPLAPFPPGGESSFPTSLPPHL